MARDIDALIAELTLDEKASLTAGEDNWSTHAVDRVGIPKVLVTDGPNGARGTFLPEDRDNRSSFCAPCGSALGSTWNVALIEELGVLLGQETRAKSCHVLLAPTVNIPRSPLFGRSFECFSEDPLLSGSIAASYIRGVQSQGVATTVKHFAGNDAEFQRMTINSVIDERTLREITLLPFEMAVRDGGSLGVMTSYNRLNGSYCTEDVELLEGILRGEWGFEGFVITDWHGRGSTAGAAAAGLDLEMPGPYRIFGHALADAIRSGEVPEAQLDASVRRLLTVFDRVGALDATPKPPPSVDTPGSRDLARRLATESMVLLKNESALLPLRADQLGSIALVGPNAQKARIMGGGSAEVRPHYRRTPLEALQARLGDTVTIVHEQGSDIDRTVPAVPAELLAAPTGSDARGGFAIEVFAGLDWAGEPIERRSRRDGTLVFQAGLGQQLPRGPFSFRATATLTAAHDGPHLLTMIQLGRARLLLDGSVIIDGIADPAPRGLEYFGNGSEEMSTTVELVAGQPHQLVVEFRRVDDGGMQGVRVGCKHLPPADLLDRAVAAAARADVAIVVVGTTNDWESEGYDRTSLELPGTQGELIARVAAVNPRTIVVTNTGAPVSMSWAGAVPAILQTWFGGQEMAEALVDVLLGASEPGGRLAITYPERIEHTPAFGNFPGEHGQVRYGEGVLVGYRWYEARALPTRYPFGHGLGYTRFVLGMPSVTAMVGPDQPLSVTVELHVTNTGDRTGSEVVQCYVAPPAGSVTRPPKELKAFAKVHLAAGATTTVRLELGARAFSYWRPTADVPTTAWVDPMTEALAVPPALAAGWTIAPGPYALHIGKSSADIDHIVEVELPG